MALQGKQIVVAVGGGIAAFKAVELVRELTRRGAAVRVAMTEAATHFVGAVTFTGITGKPAVTDLWDPEYAGEVHVELGQWADAVVVAPATANLLARAAHGLADDVVLATLACTKPSAKVLYAPAMHTTMWRRPKTQEQVSSLAADGAAFVGPEVGPLASGEVGEGRMAEPATIAAALEALLAPSGPWAGRHVLVTAGPTHEAIDPVRFVGNRSSGKMGYALVEEAKARGAAVTLVTGPVALPAPAGVSLVRVQSAVEMQAAVTGAMAAQDVIIMAAAVADYRPATVSPTKLKKGSDTLTLSLVKNPDILSELGQRRTGKAPVLVGFAVETGDLVAEARKKLVSKQCDLVVANPAATAFEGDDNEAVLVTADGATPLPRMSKRALAGRILDAVTPALAPPADKP